MQGGSPDSAECWRKCGVGMADHFHVFWSCPAIQTYWQNIISEITTVMQFEIDISFTTFYLCNINEDLTTPDKYLLKILLVAGKKAITKKWLDDAPPSVGEWTAIVQNICEMEKLTFSVRLCIDKYYKYWSKWLLHKGLYVL